MSEKGKPLDLKLAPEVSHGQEQLGREPKFSPVFLSPGGGSFHKAKKPHPPLSPETYGRAEETLYGFAGMSLAPGAPEAPEFACADDAERELQDAISPEGTASGRGASSSNGAHIDTSEEDSSMNDGVSWGIRRGEHNLLGLFGGALTLELPASFTDISAIRQVPDHQEVFMDQDSDISFIVELLGGDSSVPDAEAAAYYFNDLAECNEATSATIAEQRVLPLGAVVPSLTGVQHSACALCGTQVARNSRSGAATLDTVFVLMVVLRLPSVGTDCLFSVNIPQKSSSLTRPPPISRLLPGVEGKGKGKVEGKGDSDAPHTPDGESVGVKALRMALKSFAVVDWSLF